MADWIWQHRRHYLRILLFSKGWPVLQVWISNTAMVSLFGGLELDTLSHEPLVAEWAAKEVVRYCQR